MNMLSVVATIKRGSEPDLEAVLDAIQADQAHNPYVHLTASNLTHFARWTIIHDDDHGARLLFTVDHDCDLDAYLTELASISPDLDGLWGHCVGYTGAAGFTGFMKRNWVKTRGSYVAFQDETVQTIRTKIAVREQIEEFLRLPHVSPFLTGPRGLGTFMDRLSGVYRSTLVAPLWRRLRQGHGGLVTLLRRLVLGAALPILKWWILNQQAHSFSRVTSSCGESYISPRPHEAASFGQTSFTVFATVKRGRRLRLRFLLWATHILAKYGYPPGNFAEVFTLHEFRWMLLDNDKRLIFQSIFDGSWENYMGDFIDKIVWALDFLYTNTEDYPPAGMREVVAFKEWIRAHQPHAAVIYNAYPAETVLNLMRDREIADKLGRTMDTASATKWLELL